MYKKCGIGEREILPSDYFRFQLILEIFEMSMTSLQRSNFEILQLLGILFFDEAIAKSYNKFSF